MIENAKLKIESLQGMKEMIFQETCALLDKKEKDRIKSIGIKV